MRDCSNGEVRDRLPELMHDRLSGDALLVVRAHVAECVDCRAELTLLEQLRAAARAPRIETTRVVGMLPAYRTTPGWQRLMGSAPLRVAAAVVLLAGAYAVIRQPVEDSATPVATRAPAAQASPTPRTLAVSTRELAIGDSFQDLTDGDLAAVIEVLGELEAVIPEAIDEPVLPLTGGGA